eukprot:TRINITY_DN62894_c0_g2_i1.p1 TRINITY_DN62894_c0_g2~~TRINITY_DN62894_c0_g2_i1.p1  ORF type:complete len:310 (+),score=48.15 TRINITY_DN62894_c0_g2_i1:26-931(+)
MGGRLNWALQSLPREVLVEILNFLNASNIIQSATVCSSFSEAVQAYTGWEAQCRARHKEFSGFYNDSCPGPHDGGHFGRLYYLSDLYYLRGSAFDDQDIEDDEEREDEVEAAKKAGHQRWKAMYKGLCDANLTGKAVTVDLIETFFFYFGYGEVVEFVFSVPPRALENKDWTINHAMRAADYHEDDEKEDERGNIFDNSSDFRITTDLEKFYAAILDTGRDDEDDDEDAEEEGDGEKKKSGKQKRKEAIADLKNKLEALPHYQQLKWATGEGANCDATVDVLYTEDREVGVIAGAFILKAW